jgi:hypothetical protein
MLKVKAFLFKFTWFTSFILVERPATARQAHQCGAGRGKEIELLVVGSVNQIISYCLFLFAYA